VVAWAERRPVFCFRPLVYSSETGWKPPQNIRSSSPAPGATASTSPTATLRPRHAFWPHDGHLFSLHLVAALGLGGAEVNPLAFHPFHGPPAALPVTAGRIDLPDVPGIGFELHDEAWQAFRSLLTPPD